MKEIKKSGGVRMIPTKTSFQIADELDDIDEDEKCSYEDWAKEGEKKMGFCGCAPTGLQKGRSHLLCRKRR